MVSLSVTVVFMVVASQWTYINCGRQYCTNHWNPINGQCFKVPVHSNGTVIKRTWQAARDHCVQLEGDLAQPTDLKALTDYLEAIHEARDRFWLGGTDSIVEGEWRWIGGSKILDIGWREKQPSQTEDVLPELAENCLYTLIESGVKSLGDKECKEKFAYVCEKNPSSG